MKCGRGCHQGTGWEKVWSGRRVLVTSRWDSRRSPACLPAEAARFAGLGASHPWVYLTLGDLPPPKLLGFSRLPFPFSKSLTAAPLDAPGHRGCSGIVSWIPEIRLSESRPAILEEIAVQTVLKIHVSILLPCLSGAPLAQVLYMNNLTSNFYLESTARENAGGIFASPVTVQLWSHSAVGRSFFLYEHCQCPSPVCFVFLF